MNLHPDWQIVASNDALAYCLFIKWAAGTPVDETPQLWSEFHNGNIIQRRIGNKNSDEANDNVRGTTPGVAQDKKASIGRSTIPGP